MIKITECSNQDYIPKVKNNKQRKWRELKMDTDNLKTKEQLLSEFDAARSRITLLEQALSSSASLNLGGPLAQFFNVAEDPASFLDRNFVYQSVNSAYTRYFGKPVEKIVGLSVGELLGEDVFQTILRPSLERCLAGEYVSYEEWVDFPARGRCYMHVSYYPRIDSSGEVGGVLNIYRDQTDNKLKDLEIKNEHEKLIGILAALDTGLILINKNLSVDWINEHARHMFPEGNPVDAICYEYYAGRTKPCGGCPALKVFETGEAHQIELYRKKTGRWYSIVAQPVFDASGNVAKVLEGVTDITTRKQTEEALVKSESKWRHILINAPQVGISLDPSGKIIFVNDHFLELTGWSLEDVLGKNWFETFIPETIRDQVQGVFEAVMSQVHDHGYSNYENEILHRNGECLTVAWSNVLTLDPLGCPIDVTCMGVDVTERRRNEKALKESEERFKALHNASFGGIAIHDKGVILDCNQGLSEISGYAQEELVGMDGLLLIAERSRGEVMGNILSGYEKPYDAFGVRKSGEEYPVRLETREIPYRGRMVRVVEFRDITARKRAEANLLRSELRLRTLRDSIPDLVWLKNADGCYLSCNPAFERFLGCKEEQIIGKSDYDFFEPSLAEFFRDNDRKAIEANRPRMNEEWLTFAQDGYHGLFETLKTPLRDETGAVIGVLGVARDITARKKAEDGLRNSEMRFKRMLNAIPDMVSIHDLDMNILYSNWKGFYEVSEEKRIENTKCYKTYRGYNDVCPDCRAKNVLITKKSYQEEVKINEDLWIDLRVIPLLDSDNNMDMFIEWVRDITMLKKNEENLFHAKQVAEAANRTKSVFLANMSHEIRTPLNGVLGMLQLLDTTNPTTEQKEYILAAIQSSKRLTRLLSDILDLSRIEAGKLIIEEVEFEMMNQKQSVMELFEALARQKRLELNFVIDAQLPRKLLGDEARLRQILFNLVGNAIKFTEKGRVSIEVSLLTLPGMNPVKVLFLVQDTGVGIHPDLHKEIFEPFVQAEESYNRRFQGAGLGLSIVSKLVSIMGGDIMIDSAPGEGTTIYLSLPFNLPSERQGIPTQNNPGEHAIDDDRLRVLIAEDDNVSLLSAKRMLEKVGYAVVTAVDGQEALNILSEQEFDLVLMDIAMPILDGVEATKRIRSSGAPYACIPIIAMTAYAMSGDKEKFQAAGMNDYIAKPVELEELKLVIGRVMDKKKSWRVEASSNGTAMATQGKNTTILRGMEARHSIIRP